MGRNKKEFKRGREVAGVEKLCMDKAQVRVQQEGKCRGKTGVPSVAILIRLDGLTVG